MKISVVLLFLVLACSAFARKDKKEQNEIVESRNVPIGITTFTPHRTHEVRSGSKLFGYALRITPFVSQNFDGSGRRGGIRIKITFQLSALIFSRAALVLMVDGHRSDPPDMYDWTVDTSWGAGGSGTAEVAIDEPRLLPVLANAKEVYLTVLVPGRPAPSDQISFKLSDEQQADCRLIAGKFASAP